MTLAAQTYNRTGLMRPPKTWPFDDPKNLGTITVAEVLSRAKPVLQVSHDVSDGGWQFLTGRPVDLDQAKVVCLADMVALDPTLLELAGLRLGWQAKRRAVGKSWVRKSLYSTKWSKLVREANAYTKTQQSRLKSDFSLLEWKHFDYHQERAVLELSSGGGERLVTRIQIVGSVSKVTGTWLWAWDNASILPKASESVHLLGKYGLQHRFDRLSTATWAADEVDGWEMTAVACLLLGGEGVYRAPDDNGAMFMVLTDPRIVQAAASGSRVPKRG
jgi:hypothetical protein